MIWSCPTPPPCSWLCGGGCTSSAPHVLDDELGLRLADRADALSTLGLPVARRPAEGTGTDLRGDPRISGPVGAPFRPLMVGRARFTEDLVTGLAARGALDQYVILGAGLDTLALRHRDLLTRLSVYEIDRPGQQCWKEHRLADLGLNVPERLRFVPVDFEVGDSWTRRLRGAGFDPTSPSVLAALGLTQYISEEATTALLGEAAALTAGSTLVCSFIVPDAVIDPGELDVFNRIRAMAASRGCPFVADYAPERLAAMAERVGFDDVRHVTPAEVTALYFAGRPAGLKMPTLEHFLVARRT